MEEAKAAAYYEELLAKGAGAARSKQGLGFSSFSSSSPSAPTHSSSPIFIPGHGRDRDRDRERRRSRSPRRSSSPPRRRTSRSPPRKRSRSPSRRRSRERDRVDARDGSRDGDRTRRLGVAVRRRGSGGDARLQPVNSLELTPGWDAMTPAERVKAKMKQQLQALPSGLAQTTVNNDDGNGNDRGWERYAFDAAAPLDEDQAGKETEVDARDAKDLHVTNVPFVLPKPTQAQTEADHDAAIFGTTDTHDETSHEDVKVVSASSSPVLLNEKILQSQKSLPWQERVRLARAERASPGVSRLAGDAPDIT